MIDGGEPEPELRGDALDGVLVRSGAEVVALVDDDVPIPFRERGDVVALDVIDVLDRPLAT